MADKTEADFVKEANADALKDQTEKQAKGFDESKNTTGAVIEPGLQPKPDAIDTAVGDSQQAQANNPDAEAAEGTPPEPAKDGKGVKIEALESQVYDVGGNRGSVQQGQTYSVDKNVAEVLINSGVARKA